MDSDPHRALVEERFDVLAVRFTREIARSNAVPILERRVRSVSQQLANGLEIRVLPIHRTQRLFQCAHRSAQAEARLSRRARNCLRHSAVPCRRVGPVVEVVNFDALSIIRFTIGLFSEARL